MNAEQLFDILAGGLVEMGIAPTEAAEITEAVIAIADVAAQGALMAIELNMPDFGKNNRSAMHTTLQVLIARLMSATHKLEAELKADGAQTHDILFGVVGDHG